VVLNLHGKKIFYAMWKTLTYLFKRNGDSKNLVLKDKLRNIQIQKNETIVQYPSRFTQVRDQVGEVGDAMPSYEVVSLEVLGVSKSSHNYQNLVNG